jgi:hypothetical protein
MVPARGREFSGNFFPNWKLEPLKIKTGNGTSPEVRRARAGRFIAHIKINWSNC